MSKPRDPRLTVSDFPRGREVSWRVVCGHAALRGCAAGWGALRWAGAPQHHPNGSPSCALPWRVSSLPTGRVWRCRCTESLCFLRASELLWVFCCSLSPCSSFVCCLARFSPKFQFYCIVFLVFRRKWQDSFQAEEVGLLWVWECPGEKEQRAERGPTGGRLTDFRITDRSRRDRCVLLRALALLEW